MQLERLPAFLFHNFIYWRITICDYVSMRYVPTYIYIYTYIYRCKSLPRGSRTRWRKTTRHPQRYVYLRNATPHGEMYASVVAPRWAKWATFELQQKEHHHFEPQVERSIIFLRVDRSFGFHLWFGSRSLFRVCRVPKRAMTLTPPTLMKQLIDAATLPESSPTKYKLRSVGPHWSTRVLTGPECLRVKHHIIIYLIYIYI